ncbi:hypothetical protein CY35_06G055100 [Sphagnum magellanicum]|nr:hypothetical protein CY35_06G055100 [Sphagnum magellanicum]
MAEPVAVMTRRGAAFSMAEPVAVMMRRGEEEDEEGAAAATSPIFCVARNRERPHRFLHSRSFSRGRFASSRKHQVFYVEEGPKNCLDGLDFLSGRSSGEFWSGRWAHIVFLFEIGQNTKSDVHQALLL